MKTATNKSLSRRNLLQLSYANVNRFKSNIADISYVAVCFSAILINAAQNESRRDTE